MPLGPISFNQNYIAIWSISILPRCSLNDFTESNQDAKLDANSSWSLSSDSSIKHGRAYAFKSPKREVITGSN